MDRIQLNENRKSALFPLAKGNALWVGTLKIKAVNFHIHNYIVSS